MVGRILIGCVAAFVLAGAVHAEESAWRLYDQGVKAFQAGKLDRAHDLLEAAIRLDARCQDARYWLGLILEKRGRVKQAVEHYEKIEATYPTYGLAAERLGQIALGAGEKEKALGHFVIVAKERPSATAHMQVATVQLDLERFKEAEASLKTASEFTKGNLELLELFGRLYMETDRYKKALDAYTKIVKTMPIDNSARYLRGLCLLQLDRTEEGLREFEKVLETDPFHAMSLRSLVRAYAGDPARTREVAEYRKRLRMLAKGPPRVRPVSGK